MQKHLAPSSSHSAVNVEVVTTPRGLTLWLVRSYAVPLVSLEFAMRGGAAQDPAEKAGLGSLTAGLLDEGAGDLDSQAFHRALDEKAVEMSFHCDRDHWSGRMRTLIKNLDRAAELLRLAVNAPRFDEEPFGRVREHMNARLRHVANDPGTLANRNWKTKAFPHHPYGQPADGSLETLARIERADLIEEVAHQPAGFQARRKSHDKTEDGRPHSILQHLPQHLLALRAQCDADADFCRPLRGHIRRHTEEAHRGKDQRQRGKSDEQRRVEALFQGRFAEQLVHGEHVGDGQIAVHLRNDALYRKIELLQVVARTNHKRADVLDTGIQRAIKHRPRRLADCIAGIPHNSHDDGILPAYVEVLA